MAGQNKERNYAMNKILIIDDDRELCALIKRSVQSEHIEADFCNTGKESVMEQYSIPVTLLPQQRRILLQKYKKASFTYAWSTVLSGFVNGLST